MYTVIIKESGILGSDTEYEQFKYIKIRRNANLSGWWKENHHRNRVEVNVKQWELRAETSSFTVSESYMQNVSSTDPVWSHDLNRDPDIRRCLWLLINMHIYTYIYTDSVSSNGPKAKLLQYHWKY